MKTEIPEEVLKQYAPLPGTAVIFSCAAFVAAFPMFFGERMITFLIIFPFAVFFGAAVRHAINPIRFCVEYFRRNVRGYQYVIGYDQDAGGQVKEFLTKSSMPRHELYLPYQTITGERSPRVTGISIPLGGWVAVPYIYHAGVACLPWTLRTPKNADRHKPFPSILNLIWESQGEDQVILRGWSVELLLQLTPFLLDEFRSPDAVFKYALQKRRGE